MRFLLFQKVIVKLPEKIQLGLDIALCDMIEEENLSMVRSLLKQGANPYALNRCSFHLARLCSDPVFLEEISNNSKYKVPDNIIYLDDWRNR